jgi:heme-degrading monooxygenase HmoA
MKNNIIIFSLLLVLSSCNIAMPFNYSDDLKKTVNENQTAVIGLTYAVVGDNDEKNDVFWKNTEKVIESLPNQKGYLGHGLRFELFGDEAWTMTVWEDLDSLNNFVQSDVHKKAMRQGYLALTEASRFANVTVKRSEVPMSWEKAEKLLKEQNRGLKYRIPTKE